MEEIINWASCIKYIAREEGRMEWLRFKRPGGAGQRNEGAFGDWFVAAEFS